MSYAKMFDVILIKTVKVYKYNRSYMKVITKYERKNGTHTEFLI